MTHDDTVRLTYAELAEARGVSLGAARRMVYRHRWQKQVGNDGLSHILVPRAFVTRDPDTLNISADDTPDIRDAHSTDVRGNGRRDVSTDLPEFQVMDLEEAMAAFAQVTREVITDVSKPVILTLQEAITALRSELDNQRGQLAAERQRADRADHRAEKAENRTKEAEQHAQAVEGRILELTEQLATEQLLRIENKERVDRAEQRANEAEDRAQQADARMRETDGRTRDLQEQLTAEMAEHRRVVGMLTEQLAARRSWWPWRRRA